MSRGLQTVFLEKMESGVGKRFVETRRFVRIALFEYLSAIQALAEFGVSITGDQSRAAMRARGGFRHFRSLGEL